MLDLSGLLKTHCDEFVDILKTNSGLGLATVLPTLKTKFGYLQAIVEHERLVKSVTTVCDKRNTIANRLNTRHSNSAQGGKQDEIIQDVTKKPTENKLDTRCKQDDRKPETDCDQCDDTLKNECEQDDCETLPVYGCNQDDTKPELKEDDLKMVLIKDRLTEVDDTLDNDCKQDDIKPTINCNQDATVDNECEMDDCKAEMDYNQDDNECEQDDGKPDLNCLGLDGVGKECKQDDHDLFGDFSNAILTWSPSGWYMKLP